MNIYDKLLKCSECSLFLSWSVGWKKWICYNPNCLLYCLSYGNKNQENQENQENKEFEEIKIKTDKQRRYLPTLAEKLDRLCITQLKELLIAEHREEYAKEIKDIMYDIDLDIKEKELKFSAKTLREIIILVIMNREIWLSESAARSGNVKGNDLLKSHSLNSLRNQAKNRIQEIIPNSRKDYKIDVLTKEFIDWTPSWENDKDEL